ncbi:MAG: HNH endonuclease [Bauldia sp.]|nr:HNH endonuclease [Bauldia sp.]
MDGHRGSARERGYTVQWEKAAAAFKRAHPLCLGCEAVGLVEPATVVDHIVPHRGDQALFWDPANRQPACGWHHSAVKQTLEVQFDAGRVGVDALRLDSAEAIRLTKTMRQRSIGVDGWPVG